MFNESLKKALVGNEKSTFIYLSNFEVENFWNDTGAACVATLSLGNSKRVVNRMEEMGVLLAGADDIVVLKDTPDAAYLAYLTSLGLTLPKILVLSTNLPDKNISENLLEDEPTLAELRKLDPATHYLVPFGSSMLEEKISERTGLRLVLPSSQVCQKVNSKIYSRNLNDLLDVPQIPGAVCSTVDELRDGYAKLEPLTLAIGQPMVIKDALGVSGKGITVVDTTKKFTSFLKLLERSATAKNTRRCHYVMEKWISKRTEFNYQFLVGRDGTVAFHFIKESMVRNGVHQGHRIPHQLTPEAVTLIEATAQKLGKQLAKDGYFGIVGVDGLVDQTGTVYPNLEINARFNMSTYLSTIQEKWIGRGRRALVRQVPLKLSSPVSFGELERALSPFLFDAASGKGFLVNGFATTNAAFEKGCDAFDGRLYGAVIGGEDDDLAIIEQAILKKVEALPQYRM